MTTTFNSLRDPRSRSRRLPALAAVALLLVFQPCARADATNEIVAVSSRVSEDYARTKLPDGKFAPETFAFGEGGKWDGGMHDLTIDKLKFLDVAKVVAGPLATQGYLPTKVPNAAKLLIMVYWGTTAGTSDTGDLNTTQGLGVGNQHLNQARQHMANTKTTADAAMRTAGRGAAPAVDINDKLMALVEEQNALAEVDASMTVTQAENEQRDKLDLLNARMLGYNSTGMIGTDFGRNNDFSALGQRRRDLIEEVQDNRYFVVLMAYDFQLLWKERKHKLLWESRFSVREHGNDFAEILPGMTKYASQFFGQDSHGLLRKPLPEGHVTLEELQILEVVPDK